MIRFTTTIQQAEQQGHQTGWTFVIIPAELALKLQSGKQSFKVRGLLDEYAIKAVSLLPVGGGDFMMPLNAGMRKGIGKRKGAKLTLQLEVDDRCRRLPAPS
ncbi:DUF1905 domain-containing protein [Chitinophaga sedimenti]|uniref:DUF1905 domain-containing protein n=1 Tax=Chitinophaga sedimenti TaxID=2033606 RepID=UPI002003CB32|nr:DUF1905 domain-containing protein [Chitinophaga sedimenti]MCK7557533.1 DUF1905 domain-containing protein [Chitinophaga sedimenti]